MQKNDELILKIEDMGVDGAGIGKADGMTFFVKDAVIGDVVRAKVMKLKKTYGYARLMELLEASPDRVEPKCPYYRQCGGCQIQALSYEKQLEFKERKVRNNLERIGGFSEIPMEPIVGMEEPYHYRNKAQFPVGTDKDGHIVTGFYAGRTHTIIPNRDCALGLPVNREILDLVIDFMEKYHVSAFDEKTGKGLVRHVLIRCGFTSQEKMVCLIINGKSLPHSEKLVEALRKIDGMTSISINCNTERTNVILGRKTVVLWGQEYITDQIGEISYEISPVSFYQVNPVQTEKLYGLALEYADLHGEENVWDLYCGIGTISLFLSQKADKVYGVEIVEQAVKNARENAALNEISNVEFFAGAAEEVVPAKYRESGGTLRSDVVVLDPPRKGCDEKLLQTVIQMEPKRIVYVSCDPATLARDLKYFGENGYVLKRICPCDMFGHSYHVETVCLLSKRSIMSM